MDAVDSAEAFSFWTHGISAVACVAVLVLLVIQADGPLAITAAAIYGGTLVLLFSSSTFHHVVGQMGPKWHAVSRRIDHIAIFALIAGSYTPITLLALPPAWGWSVFGVVWGIAIAGTVLKLFTVDSPRWMTAGIYVVMGWVAIVAIWPLIQVFDGPALSLLGGGGLVYTVGAVIYARKWPDPWPARIGFHGTWHLFVMAGAALHVALMWLYVI